MNYVLEDMGRQLQRERDRQGLTQRALAKRTGTSQARVSTIENGEKDIRLSTLVEFARTLGLEFMLVPRQHVPAVRALIADHPLSSAETSPRPAYRLDEDDDA